MSKAKIWFGSREIWIVITLLLLFALNIAAFSLIQAKHGNDSTASPLQAVHGELKSGMNNLLLFDIIVFGVAIACLSRGCKGNCLQIPEIIPGMKSPKPLATIGSVKIGSREVWIILSSILLVILNLILYNLFMQRTFMGEPLTICGFRVDFHKYAIPIILAEAAIFALAIAKLGRGCSAFCVHVRQHQLDSAPKTDK